MTDIRDAAEHWPVTDSAVRGHGQLVTLRTDTVTFGFVMLGTIVLLGALTFMPAAVLGPVAEHYGPIPFGR